MNKSMLWFMVALLGMVMGGVIGLSVSLSLRQAEREIREEQMAVKTEVEIVRSVPRNPAVNLFALDESKGVPTIQAQKSSLGKLAFLYDRLQGRVSVGDLKNLLEQITQDKDWDLSPDPGNPRFNDRDRALHLLMKKWVRMAPRQAFEAWVDGERNWDGKILYEEWKKVDPESADSHYWENWHFGVEY